MVKLSRVSSSVRKQILYYFQMLVSGLGLNHTLPFELHDGGQHAGVNFPAFLSKTMLAILASFLLHTSWADLVTLQGRCW